jgi:NADH-quinone oxidoreductase subunit M
MPLFIVMLFFFLLGNIGFPLTCNFVGEFLVLVGVMQSSFLVAFLASTGIIFSSIYSFFFFNRISFLELTPHIKVFKDLSYRESSIVFILFFSEFFLGIYPQYILDLTNFTVHYLLTL